MTVNRQAPLTYAALTNVGMRRANNQDSHAVVLAQDARQWRERGHVFLVADGMGAHAAGELASRMAADGVIHAYLQRRDQAPADAIRQAVRDLNAQIHERGESSIEFKGMGTTCSALAILPQGALVAHVGDSRVYRARKGVLEQLSFDHSLVWELRAAGDLADADTVHLPKNIITRSLGPNASVEVDLEGPFPIEVGDCFLLCSDGLTGEVRDEEIGVILDTLPPDEAAQVLIDLANLRGGPDNITVIVVRIDGEELSTKVTDLDAAANRPVSGRAAGFLRSLMWILAAAGAAVAVGGLLAPRIELTLGGGAAAVLCILFALLIRAPSSASRTAGRSSTRRYGQGPHTSRQCVANARFVEDLATLANQLRAAIQERGEVDELGAVEEIQREAAAAATRKDWGAAVRHYCRAIRAQMEQLRAGAS